MTCSSLHLLDSDKILELIKPNGLLSRTLKGFESRDQQQKMMQHIIEAYNKNHIALIEAGTGTGKSLAYLIPALIWAAECHERTVISTNTIALQEQLIQKDIPHLLQTLNLKMNVVLVKGMSHYLCLRKLEEVKSELGFFQHENYKEIEDIEVWSRTVTQGSRADLPFNPTSATWDLLGAEHEACLHNECPHFQKCYFYKARRQAQEAQLLIVNHHLLFTDLEKRMETGNYSDTCILPAYKRIILDEAHHIEEIATELLAKRLNRLDLMRTLSRLLSDKQLSSKGKLVSLKEKIQLFFNKSPPENLAPIMNRLTIELPALRHKINDSMHQTFDTIIAFVNYVKNSSNGNSQEEIQANEKLLLTEILQKHTKWQKEVLSQIYYLIDVIKEFDQGLKSIEIDLKLIMNDRFHEQTKNIRIDVEALRLRLLMAINLLEGFKELQEPSKVRWIECQKLKSIINVQLVDADLDLSQTLVNFLFSKFPTIILCSATLSSHQKFDYYRQRLGLNEKLLPEKGIKEHIFDSPFNYERQALFAIPTDLPPPSHPDFNEIAYENVWKGIEASNGNAFILFTSYQMLQECYFTLAQRLENHHYRAFKQGDHHRQGLLEKFKSSKRGVLFGTDSFWEGVDVIGDALRCVIIVKLPFKVPNEPIIQARTEAILKRGGDPFNEYTIPQAVMKFKQGFGRLIRHKSDRGCIICLDNRLVTKSYGKYFLNSLPPCERAFMNGSMLWPKIKDFYYKTTHFVKQNLFSIR